MPPGRTAGEGPDAYPSGTPPYGIPGIGGGFGAGAPGPDGDPFAAAAGPGAAPGAFGVPNDGADQDVPKTETTLTTRISINIPGSRPIPPVVMRSTVKPDEAEPAADSAAGRPAPAGPAAPTGPRHRSAGSTSPVLGVMDSGGRTATPPDLPPEWQLPSGGPDGSDSESTGEWFRPRQKGRPEPVAAPGATRTTPPNPAPAASGLAAGSPYQQAAPPAAAPAPPFFSSETSQQVPVPRPTGAPASPFAAADELLGGGGQFGAPQVGAPQYDDTQFGAPQGGYPVDPYATGGTGPYHRGQGADPFGTGPGAPRQTAAPAAPAGNGTGAPGRFARPQQPINPYPAGHGPSADGRFGGEQGGGEPEDTQIGGFDPITDGLPPAGLPPEEAIPGLPVNGRFGAAPRGTTATAPAAARPAAGPPPPPGAFSPDRPERPERPVGMERPAGPQGAAPAAPAPAPTPAPKPAATTKPKGRPRAQKLLVTAVGGALFLGAAAYGTGLMLNQADVPRGTTVLGTDIGGASRDQAIHQLDSTVGKIGQQPIQLKIGDQALSLDPATAGLGFDTTATVDGLTKHSYNPSEVIGSLAGGSTAVPPVVHVDRAKLKVALDGLAASSAHGLKEGFVQFSDTGDPTVVPGQAGQAVDGSAAVDQVEQSYRDRAAGKADTPIALAVTAAQPKVATQSLQQAADGLGKAIASGKVTVTAGVGAAARKFVFTKAVAGKALTLAPDASGNIGPKWDLDQLGSAVGSTFDKTKFRKSDGTLAPITTQDVADAIASVYDKNTDAERTFKFRM